MSDPRIVVLTDSTADIPADIAQAHGIEVVPLQVTFGEESFLDGELTQAQFFERMAASRTLPTTSTPAVGVFAEAYERILASADHIVSIHVSEGLSGTIDSARQAASAFADRVTVFDSRNLSWGLGFQVLMAARAVQAGAALADVITAAERTRDRVRMIVGVDKLDNLARGGRIGAVSAMLGGLLDLRVSFTVAPEGVFAPVARVRGAKAHLRGMLAWIDERLGESKRGTFCIMHAMAADRAEEVRRALEAAYDVTEMFVVETGVVISTHTGTGIGIAVIPAD